MTVQTPIENRMDAFRERWNGKVGKMLIGGEWRESASGETFSAASTPRFRPADTNRAAGAARMARRGWRPTPS